MFANVIYAGLLYSILGKGRATQLETRLRHTKWGGICHADFHFEAAVS